ncbi:glycosyltransferase [Ruminococcaceae bacterium OttesenSCG-928-O06]|nr:glycosyltransferase [Ruminococcaceae bacterium OttesenSCG-928-O06]
MEFDVLTVPAEGAEAALFGQCTVHRQQNPFASAVLPGTAPWVLVLAQGLAPAAGFFTAAKQGIAARPAAAGFALRCVPGGGVGYIDPVSLEAQRFCGGAALLRRTAVEEVGGFDAALPPPAALYDLALRLRGAGGALYYLPRAVLHSTGQQAGDEGLGPYVDAARGELLLAYKYGGVPAANRRYFATLKNPQHYPGVRRALAGGWVRHLGRLWGRLAWRWGHAALRRAAGALRAQDFALDPGPEAPVMQAEGDLPAISVVVRTHARPARLRCTLQSLANQTHQNFEVVVVEDGAPTAQTMVEQEFSHLPVRYIATGENVGRGKAGNIGLAAAKGPYLNLLDDDDYFYPEHLETMAALAAAHPAADLLTTSSVSMEVDVESEVPYRHVVRRMVPIEIDRMDVFTMCQTCQVHVAGVVFKKSLFEACGGLDEALPAHEDWAMWLRFFAKGKRANPTGVDTKRITTVFVQPADEAEARRRMQQYMQADETFFGDESIRFDVSLGDMRRFYDGVIADMRHVQALGKLDDFLDAQARRGEERP